MAKSWDIQPKRASGSPAPRIDLPRRQDTVRRPASAPHVSVTRRDAARRTATPPTPRAPLRRRRRARRTRLFIVLLALVVVLCVLSIAALWQPWLRVVTINASGPDATQLESFAMNELSGTRFLIIPKNSLLFLPIRQLRSSILAAFPDIEAVTISPSGFTSLTLTPIGRSSAFWWCGTSLSTPQGSCYDTDASGYVYAPVVLGGSLASTSMLWVYAPLATSSDATTSPLGQTLADPSLLPPLIQFVKTLESLGAVISSVNIRGDEADLYTAAGTRITYVLGHESEAAQLAVSAFPQLNLNDGSLLYVDLRFADKVYYKKTDDTSSTPTTL